MVFTKQDVLEFFSNFKLEKDQKDYLYFHPMRYAFLLNIIRKHLPNNNCKILDVGPSFQTFLIKKWIKNKKVDTLGFFHKDLNLVNHIEFDLNNSNNKAKWPKNKKYDVVLMAEVLEYLYLPPEEVFEFLNFLLNKDGKLILQVSNAVALYKRREMLFGKKTLGKIIGKNEKDIHLREYTYKDLIKLGMKTGFRVEKIYLRNYFYSGSKLYSFFRWLFRNNPNTREGITIIYSKK